MAACRLVGVVRPADAVRETGGDAHALGIACRTRGVDHVGLVMMPSRGLHGATAAVVGDIEAQSLDAGGQALAQRRVRDRQRHTGIVEHERDALARIVGIDRHIGGADFSTARIATTASVERAARSRPACGVGAARRQIAREASARSPVRDRAASSRAGDRRGVGRRRPGRTDR